MSESAVADTRIELIRAARSATERGDREAFARVVEELCHPDCVWTPLIADVEGGGPYTGRDGLLAFYDDFAGSFEVRYEDSEYRPVGEDALLELTTMRVRGHESDIEVRQELGIVYEFESGRLLHGRAYDSHPKVIEDAEGLDA